MDKRRMSKRNDGSSGGRTRNRIGEKIKRARGKDEEVMKFV